MIGKRHGILARGLAVFFLLFTFVDIATPQNCGEELLGFKLKPQAASTGSAITRIERDETDTAIASFSAIENDSKGSPSESAPSSSDEDCFCCCAHIVPGMNLNSTSIPVLTAPVPGFQHLTPYAAHLRGTYHPPRLT